MTPVDVPDPDYTPPTIGEETTADPSPRPEMRTEAPDVFEFGIGSWLRWKVPGIEKVTREEWLARIAR